MTKVDWMTSVWGLLSVGASLVAAASCLLAARRVPARRRGWVAVAGATLCWGAGDLARLHASSSGVLSPLAAAATADALALVALAFIGKAVVAFVGPALRGIALLRAALDGLVVGLSLFLFSWTTFLAPRDHVVVGTWAGAVEVISPLLHICVVAVVLVGGARLGGRVRTSWWLLAGGTALIAAGDSVLTYLNVADLIHISGSGSLGRIAGVLLVGLAARLRDDETPAAGEVRAARTSVILLPYVPILFAAAQIASQRVAGEIDPVSMVFAGAVIVALGARQLLVQFETLDLTRNLERRVRERTEALGIQERRFRSLAQNSSDLLMVLDPYGAVSYASDAVGRVLGFGETELLGRLFTEVVHPDDFVSFLHELSLSPPPPAPPGVVEVRLSRRDGTWATAEVTVTNLLGDEVVGGILLTIRDIAERRALEERLRHDALHDPLTGLGNRQLFGDRLDHAAARGARSAFEVVVFVLDLDDFKTVNDTLGHGAGDDLLVEIGARLSSTLRASDTVSRMGGDEFAVLFEHDGTDDSFVENVASRLLANLAVPVQIAGKSVVPSVSMGVAVGASCDVNCDTMLRSADLALYVAKEQGKGRYTIFEPGMEAAATAKVEIESDLRDAVRNDGLVLHYQPIVGLPSGRIVGVEALVRWNHPTRGLVPPDEFIPIAEESELIGELGRWVLNRACADLRSWQLAYPDARDLTVAVNVATRQLMTPWLVDQVSAALAAIGLAPGHLTLEITEGAIMADTRASLATLDSLRALGVNLAIDDFGTGWSSLARLRTFPVDKLKIDRAFVSEVTSAHDDAPMLAAVTAMAHNLGLQVVAEGVETVEQLACLHGLGCDEVQGYLLSRPVPAERLEALLADTDGLLVAGGMAEVGADPEPAPDAPAGSEEAMLFELVRLSGAGAAYLTSIDMATGIQSVIASASFGPLSMPTDHLAPFDAAPCGRALAGASPVCTDLAGSFPGHPLVAAGATWHLSVPVEDEAGRLSGTLCLAASAPVPEAEVALVFARLFSRILTPRPGEVAPAHSEMTPA